MLIKLKETYSYLRSEGYDDVFDYTLYEYNTDTRLVNYTNEEYYVPAQEGAPDNYSRPVEEEFYWYCLSDTPTRRGCFHDGTGGVNYVDTADSIACGWEPNIVITSTVINAVCFGSNSGSIGIDVSGTGAAPYTYRWNDGETTKDRFNVPAGSYAVTVTDAQGFSNTLSGITVGQNSEIQVVGTIGENSILIEASGGVLPYSFRWSDGVTTKDRENVAPGRYELTVTDGAGCSQTFVFMISTERFYFSKNPLLLQLQATDLENKPNLRFICEVWVEPEYLSGEFVLATPEPFEHPADENGYTQFDVSDILDAFVEPHLPEFNQGVVLRADKCFKRFYLRHTEAFGDPITLAPFAVQDNRYVICGGLDSPEHYANTYFTSFRQNRKPFFTWEPVIKNVLPGQPEYLYFMPDSFDLVDFRVKTKVVYSDGSTATFTLFTQAGIKRFELYAIPAGHDQLGLGETQPGKQVRQWDIYVVDAYNNVLSETRRYVVDHRNYEQVRFFLYANSIGGYNTLAATGRAKLSVDPQAQLLDRNRPLDALSGDTTIVSKYSKRTLQLSTGHKSKAELQALQDFLNSEDVKLVGTDRYISGRLSDKAADTYDEADTLNAFSFDFVLAKMHSYTPQLRLSGYTDESALLTPLAP
jgi:hypothetical protein